MNKILFITTRYPFPIFGGDKLRAFDIIKFLSKKNKIDLVCLGNENKIEKKSLNFCKNIKVFHLNFLSRIVNSTFSLLKFQPLQNGFCLSNDMKNYIDDVKDKYDSIICHLLRSAQYLPREFRGKKILEITDLQSLAYQKFYLLKGYYNIYLILL